MSITRTDFEVADIIDAFLDGSCEAWDWDDFTSLRITDPELEFVRMRCVEIYDEFPASEPGQYCNAQGVQNLRAIAKLLRDNAV